MTFMSRPPPRFYSSTSTSTATNTRIHCRPSKSITIITSYHFLHLTVGHLLCPKFVSRKRLFQTTQKNQKWLLLALLMVINTNYYSLLLLLLMLLLLLLLLSLLLFLLLLATAAMAAFALIADADPWGRVRMLGRNQDLHLMTFQTFTYSTKEDSNKCN